MADPEHVAKLRQGVKAWNTWREENPNTIPHLNGADLSKANLKGAFPVTEKCAKEILSLPMFPEMKLEEINYVAECVKKVI